MSCQLVRPTKPLRKFVRIWESQLSQNFIYFIEMVGAEILDLWIPFHLKSWDFRIPEFGMLFDNSNSAHVSFSVDITWGTSHHVPQDGVAGLQHCKNRSLSLIPLSCWDGEGMGELTTSLANLGTNKDPSWTWNHIFLNRFFNKLGGEVWMGNPLDRYTLWPNPYSWSEFSE